MANIAEFLQNILSARYGKDVRQSIHDAIEEIDKVADTAKGSATESAESARISAQTSALNAQKTEQFRNDAERFRNEAFYASPDGYEELVGTVSENKAKIDTIIEKADLGIKETASGEEIHLTDSAESKAVEFALYGKATQDGEPTPENPVDIVVSGESYNLLKNTATSQTIGGVNFTVNEDKSVTVNGTPSETVRFIIASGTNVLDANNYIMSGCPSGGSTSKYSIQYYNGTQSNGGNDYGDGFAFKHNESDNVIIQIIIIGGYTANNLTFYPMIRKASVKNDRYMPYGVGSVEVKSCGNQLANLPDVEETNISGVKWSCKNGAVTAVGTATSISPSSGIGIKCDIPIESGNYYIKGTQNDVSVYVQIIDANGNSSWVSNKSFPLDGTEQRAFVFCQVNSGKTVNKTIYPMLNKGSEPLPFEPYKETLSTIPVTDFAGIPVDSGGNYTDQSGQQWICDEIVKYADGSGEYVQRVGKNVFGGSSDEVWTYSEAGGAIRFLSGKIRNLVSKPLSASNKGNLICNLFKITTANNTYLGREEGIAVELNGNLSVYYSKWTSTNDIIESLANSNMIVYYELAEPIRTPLTAEQIAEIEKISTFYPVTNISNDFDCGMKVTYLADSKNYIDNQLALQAQAREQEMVAMFMLLPEETQAKMIENDINNLLLESEV